MGSDTPWSTAEGHLYQTKVWTVISAIAVNTKICDIMFLKVKDDVRQVSFQSVSDGTLTRSGSTAEEVWRNVYGFHEDYSI
ncbi:hypothetical protein DPMN_078875 [Dreissena polymorpha]|uniref:Uncharacterized protein n=1 Tax=Dreissena polymorpha TaxID=45954 RepID=A0A9D3YTD3_DREPO|nr:hypothetical protein DPMN_078875 [Dreissena polymorpha]